MKTYEVHIERTAHYIVTVEAQDENDAEVQAWLAYDPANEGFASNDITAVLEVTK